MKVRVTHVHNVGNGDRWVRYQLTPDLWVSVHEDGRVHVHNRTANYTAQSARDCQQGIDLIPEN